MVKTIGNPLSWGTRTLFRAGRGAGDMVERLGGHDAQVAPKVQKLTTDDLLEALRAGIDDFAALRTDVMMLCLLYPIIGIVLAWAALDRDLLPILFPMISGFALIGPLAAVGLYEMSRLRELGKHPTWLDAFNLLRSTAFGPILMMGIYMLALFVVWILVALKIWEFTLGPEAPASAMAFAGEVVGTSEGWTMIVVGMGVGFLFACVALAVTVVSFPMLVDRDVGLPRAVVTSVKVARENPRVIATWGLIVAVSLGLGAIPALLGLVIVLPVLGHATWHLYRRAVKY